MRPYDRPAMSRHAALHLINTLLGGVKKHADDYRRATRVLRPVVRVVSFVSFIINLICSIMTAAARRSHLSCPNVTPLCVASPSVNPLPATSASVMLSPVASVCRDIILFLSASAGHIFTWKDGACAYAVADRSKTSLLSVAKNLSLPSCPRVAISNFETNKLTNNLNKMKRNLLKTVLVAVGLVAGMSSAWADTFNILYGVPNTDAGGKVVSVSPQGDFTGDTNEAKDIEFTDANGNNCATAMPIGGSVLFANRSGKWSKNFETPATEGKIFFSGNYNISANNSQTFKIVDSNGYVIYGSAVNNTGSNAELAVANICGTEIINYVRQPRKCAYGVKSLCIDLDARTVTYALIVSSGNNSYTEKTGTVDLPNEVLDVKGLSVEKTNYGCYLDNVCLYNQISETAMYNYTINYICNGTIVSTSSARVEADTEVQGQSIIYDSEENKYFVSNGESSLKFVVSEDNAVFNVDVRKAYSATLNITTIIDGNNTGIKSISFVEADDNSCTWSYCYPKYAEYNGEYYVCQNSTFGWSEEFSDGNVIEKTINYSSLEENVVCYFEAENLNAIEPTSLISNNKTYSNGGTAAIKGDNYTNRGFQVGTFAAGSYQFVAYITKNENRNLLLRDASSTESSTNKIAVIEGSGLQVVDFVLTQETSLVLNGKDQDDTKVNQSADFDYFLIKKIGEATTTVTIPGNAFATYCPAYPVEFAADGAIEAYKASVDEAKQVVNLTRTYQVAAGEGVLVHAKSGETATEKVNIIAPIEKDASNAFVGTLEGLIVDDSNYGTVYFLGNGSKGLGFYKAANGGTLAAGKAYLSLPATSEAKSYSIAFGGDTTGINEVVATAKADGAYYTLSGVRVENPTKGLYIQNGKKVIIK